MWRSGSYGRLPASIDGETRTANRRRALTWQIIVQWVHVVAGVVWAGGQAFVHLAIWPALLRRPAPEARAFMPALGAVVAPVMSTSGMVVMGMGIVRGTVLGPIRSWRVLFASPYGWSFIAALVLTAALIARGAGARTRIPPRVWDGDAYRPGAARYLRTEAAISLTLLAALLVTMVLMRFGL